MNSSYDFSCLYEICCVCTQNQSTVCCTCSFFCRPHSKLKNGSVFKSTGPFCLSKTHPPHPIFILSNGTRLSPRHFWALPRSGRSPSRPPPSWRPPGAEAAVARYGSRPGERSEWMQVLLGKKIGSGAEKRNVGGEKEKKHIPTVLLNIADETMKQSSKFVPTIH